MGLLGSGADVLDHLHVAPKLRREGEEVFVVRVNEFICRFVGAVVPQPLIALGGYLRPQDEVDELVGGIRMGCVYRMKLAMIPNPMPSLG
jgi:hypothetical protein